MRYLKFAFRIIVSVGLLVYLFHLVSLKDIGSEFVKIIQEGGINYLVSAFALTILSVIFLSFRWHIILRGYHFESRVSRLIGYYMIGMFFNNFLPSTIGGDVIRVYKISNDIENRTTGLASVIIERLMGIAATVFMACFAILLLWQEYNNPQLLYASLAMFTLIVFFFLVLVRTRPFALLLRLLEKLTIFNIGERFSKLFEAIHFFQGRRRILLFAFLMSVLAQSTIVFMNYALAKAMSMDVSLWYLFMVVPATFVLTMLPSINGIGIREFGFVQLLGEAGVPSAAALSLSFMNLIIPMLISLGGAALFIIQKRKTSLEENNVIKEVI